MDYNMSTKIRAKISLKNKYWISINRYYELKYFCLQYPQWKKEYTDIDDKAICSSSLIKISSDKKVSDDKVAKYAIEKIFYSDKIDMIEKAAMDADPDLYMYILRGVTESLSYTYLKSRLDIPCGRDMYYDRYRRFFWLLNKERW